MQGGVRPFRGTGSDARRYVEADRSTADDYYLDGDAVFAAWTLSGADGTVRATASLAPEQYAAWVDWTHPLTGERMGVPRKPGDGKQGSPRFQEMIVNAPKSLSMAAALHPDVSAALDAAQADAADQIRRYLALHATTRVGPRGAQQVVPVEGLQTVSIVHHTSRAGDPHRHIHFQIGTRVWAAGAWRGLDGVALFKIQGALRTVGTGVIAAHPGLADTLAAHGLTLDPTTGEVLELERFNQAMSKRGLQVETNLAVLRSEWEQAHPSETMSHTTSGRLHHLAWAQNRPGKKPATLAGEAEWITELRAAGYDPATVKRARPVPVVPLGTLGTQQIAARALDRCGSDQSAWTPHQIREHVAALVAETGVRATGEELRRFIDQAATLALAGCVSVLPAGLPHPEHVAHLTNARVIAAETTLRDLLTSLVPPGDLPLADVAALAAARGLDDGQARAAAAVASGDPLVIVEGAAGSGKTSMLAVALAAIQHDRDYGSRGLVRVLAPTRRAAQVAQQELGVPATSVAALIHQHGWRWDTDGVWTRLAIGDTDPYTGRVFNGPPQSARLARGERVIVDEAGMLDQDTTTALLTLVTEAGATVALVGDRAQLPAIGRGGVLDIAASVRGRTFDMTEVHRFTDPAYAALTIAMRDRDNPGQVFERLAALDLIRLHASQDEQQEHIAAALADGETVTVSTNDEATMLNQAVRARRVASGLVDDTVTVTGSDGLPIGKGDLIQTRRNNSSLSVTNRQTWTVQHVQDGQLWARPADASRTTAASLVRLPADYVSQWAHLSYATTAYGVQGVTTPASRTILTEALDAAGAYVGMTRGRHSNLLHIVAENMADARQQYIDAMGRDRADRGLAAVTRQAIQDITGLVEPAAQIVNQETARLRALAGKADANAQRWQQAADALARLADQHQQAHDQQQGIVDEAQNRLEQTFTAVLGHLSAEAATDAQTMIAAHQAMETAHDAARHAGLFGRKTAQLAADRAQATYQDMLAQVCRRWGSIPTSDDSASWTGTVAAQATMTTPQVVDAQHEADQAKTDLWALARQQSDEKRAANVKVYGSAARLHTPSHTAAQHADDWRIQADAARFELARLGAMPPVEAVQLIEQNRAARADADAKREVAGTGAFQSSPASHWAAPQRSATERRDPGFGL